LLESKPSQKISVKSRIIGTHTEQCSNWIKKTIINGNDDAVAFKVQIFASSKKIDLLKLRFKYNISRKFKQCTGQTANYNESRNLLETAKKRV
jgi:hypothetical protein